MIWLLLAALPVITNGHLEGCCGKKTVDGITYILKGEGKTDPRCSDNCIYNRVDDPKTSICFIQGKLESACEDRQARQIDCFSEPDVGPCRGAIPRWYSVPGSGGCQEFTYGGCEGNGNNFNSRIECEDACGNELPVMPPLPPPAILPECQFSWDCMNVRDCASIMDAYCVCNFGQCVITGNPFFTGKQCSSFTDCPCRNNMWRCFCRNGFCEEEEWECHEDRDCAALEKCDGGMNCRCQENVCEPGEP